MHSLGNKKLDDLQKQFLKLSKQQKSQLEKPKSTNVQAKKPLPQHKTKITFDKPKQTKQSKITKDKRKNQIVEEQKQEVLSNEKEQLEVINQFPKTENILENSPIISPINSPIQISKENYFLNPYGLNSVTARSYNSHLDIPSQQQFLRESSLSKYCPQSPDISTVKEYADTLNLSERQFSPKFYHQHMINKINYKSVLSSYQKDLQSSQRGSLLHSSRRDFVSENKQSTRNIYSARSYNKSELPFDQQSLYQPPETAATVLNFYTDILRTLETLRFILNNNSIVELAIEQSVSSKSDLILSRKLGQEAYQLLKKLYVNARKERVGEEGIRDRQIINLFGKQLQLFGKTNKFNQHSLEIIIQKQMLKRKVISFQDFVEIFYSVSKLASTYKQLNNDECFRRFIEHDVKSQMNFLELAEKDTSPEQICIFFEPYNPFENPAVVLFYENHEFLKHIFSLYENTNYKLDKEENFISLKNFIKLSKDYLVIPNFCRIQQATKIFRAFQKGNNEIVSFTGLIITFCCIAHLGLLILQLFKLGFINSQLSNDYPGFYHRISKLIETMKNANNGIAEDLMQQTFSKYRE